MDLSLNNQPWMQKSHCAGTVNPDGWDTKMLSDKLHHHANSPEVAIAAAKACEPCPVWRDCGKWALDNGIVGMVCAGVALPTPSGSDSGANFQEARRRISVRLGLEPERERIPVPRTVKSECRYGHKYTPENTRIRRRPSGKTTRECRTCNQALARARWDKLAEAKAAAAS